MKPLFETGKSENLSDLLLSPYSFHRDSIQKTEKDEEPEMASGKLTGNSCIEILGKKLIAEQY